MEQTQTQKYNSHNITTAFHDAGTKKIVVFCHGFRGTSIGPNRFFVQAARKLAQNGISSLRFDQYCSGNSDGDFINSSFNDWVATTTKIAEDYLGKGYQVALFGQSMGGATVICVSAALTSIAAAVAWVPDPNVGLFTPPESGFVEEGGQRVCALYWREAHDIRVADKLRGVKAPMYIVQCSDDEHVSAENREAIANSAQTQHKVELFEGYKHSMWTHDQAEDIINRSVDFLIKSF
ncbi:MAG TPA: alpha/beta fold hydrolase [Patescibacteria group bacterium]|nr:alpha/beta fold hydrolase [Patescibacteria group bacterium]